MPAVAQEKFIDLQVRDIRRAPDTANPDSHVVLLEERDGEHRLAIWIGREQAILLALRLEHAELARPGTYDMTAAAIRALGGRLREVRIDRLSDNTFYAIVALEGLQGPAEVDARPSDAINLALAGGTPIRADRVMVEQAVEAGARETPELWERRDVEGSREILHELLKPPEGSPG